MSTDLVLINPSAKSQMYGSLGVLFSGIEPPLWCALLAAFVRMCGYTVQILDPEAENWSITETVQKAKKYNPRLIGIIVLGSNPSASSTPKMTATRTLLEKLKAKYLKQKQF